MGHLNTLYVSCFLVSTPSLYHPLSITLSVSICLCCTNYGSHHLSLYQFPWPLSPPLAPSHPLLHIHFSPINTFFLAVLLLQCVFLTSSSQPHVISFFPPSLISLPSPLIPSLFLSLSLGTIKASAVPQRMMQLLWHLQRRNYELGMMKGNKSKLRMKRVSDWNIKNISKSILACVKTNCVMHERRLNEGVWFLIDDDDDKLGD